ncbi:hypothetical protein [Paramagnetospirillum marisnigri]|nr:hypothetical protein [Paramagnetospirillum marisnigri]
MKTMLRPLVLLSALALAACQGANQSTGGPAVSRWSVPEDGATETAALPRFKGGRPGPDNLRGMTLAQVEDSLGKPSFRRKDPPAEIWQYRVKVCTLDLFLYEEKGGVVVTHYAVRAPQGGGITDKGCLDEVLDRKDGLPTS